jgi:hypothetical protein
MTHLEKLAKGTIAIDPSRLILELGGGYTLENLTAGCAILPPRDQLVLRHLLRKPILWLKSRGLVTKDEFAALWQFATTTTTTDPVSPLSRARLEYHLSHLNRSNHYHAVRCNALLMLALGLGIHPRHAYALKVQDVKAIRALLLKHNCYTRWAWAYIEKLMVNRRIHIKPYGYAHQQLFINLDGTPMDIGMAHSFVNRWPAYYHLDYRQALVAHRTMAVELAGVKPQLDALYKEIFTRNGTITPTVTPAQRPQPAPVLPPPDDTTAVTNYWSCTRLTPAPRPPLVNRYRSYITNHWLDARRNQAVHRYLSEHRPQPVDSDPGPA